MGCRLFPQRYNRPPVCICPLFYHRPQLFFYFRVSNCQPQVILRCSFALENHVFEWEDVEALTMQTTAMHVLLGRFDRDASKRLLQIGSDEVESERSQFTVHWVVRVLALSSQVPSIGQNSDVFYPPRTAQDFGERSSARSRAANLRYEATK